MSRQLDIMHKLHGRNAGRKCGDCSNLVSGRYHNKILRKCERYGLTHSEASDWALSWVSCGQFGVPLPDNERPVIEWYRDSKREQGPLDGQIGMI